MSVGLYRYNENFDDRDSEVNPSENISTQRLYEEHWEKATDELKGKHHYYLVVSDHIESELSVNEIKD